jgi:hypothetical protein
VANAKRRKVKKRPVRHFYLNGELHSKLVINRGKDLIYAWNHTQNRLESYLWSHTRKVMEPGFSTKEVADMLGRSVFTMHKYVEWGLIPEPQRLKPYFNVTGHMSNTHKKVWSRQDVFNMHECLSERHWGKARKDGIINPGPLPSKQELNAMMKHDMVLYVRTSQGEFVPAWKEAEW